MKITTVIFDFDGTIADILQEFVIIMNEFADKYHLRHIKPGEVEFLRNLNAFELIELLEIPLHKIPFLLIEGKKVLRARIQSINCIAGLEPVLRELHKSGYTLGILTSNDAANVEAFLSNHNLSFFNFIKSENNLFGKDKALRKLLKQHGLKKEEVMYVGDEVRDIEACKKVHIDVTAVSWGLNSHKALAKLKPTHLIDTPDDLLQVLVK